MSGEIITVIGAGPVGSLLAIYLAKAGFKVKIYEKRSHAQICTAGEGRSVNIALSVRGWNALNEVSLKHKVQQHSIPMYGRIVHKTGDVIEYQPYSEHNEAIYSISRNLVNSILVEEAQKLDVEIYFEHELQSIDLNTGKFIVKFGNDSRLLNYTKLFCADGIRSILAKTLHENAISQYTLDKLDYGYIEINMPPDRHGNFLLQSHGLHIWPRKKFMLIALPNTDGSFTCTLFLPMKGQNSFETLMNSLNPEHFFKKHFKDFYYLMKKHTLKTNFLTQFSKLKVGSLSTLRIFPWSCSNACLIGDSAHAITPFYGQGMNCGFEDVSELYKLLKKYNFVIDKNFFIEFENSRKPNTDAIAQMALENFYEMRDGVANEKYLEKKKLMNEIIKKSSGKFLNQYHAISFSDIPYKTIYENGLQLENYIANYE